MVKLQVYDPPMCCSSGVCGNNVDTRLVTFASDIEWLKKQGIEVERYGLSFNPDEFVKNEIVKNTLKQEGNNCLPLIVADNTLAYKGNYPSREKLAEICNINWESESSQDAVTAGTETSNNICGPECDCHKSAVSDNAKKIIFGIVLFIIAGIIVFKLCYKANATEINTENKVNQAESNILISNKKGASKLGKYISSISQAKSQDVAFVFIPAKGNEGISASAKDAALSAKKALNNKNIKVGLYTLKTSSSDYSSVVSQTTPPAFLVIYKGQTKKYVSGQITETKLLQAYVAATRDCGSGCPCHK